MVKTFSHYIAPPHVISNTKSSLSLSHSFLCNSIHLNQTKKTQTNTKTRKMSWLRNAVNKAVEVGGKNNLSRIRNYADTVVQQAGQAVVGGAKILQDRMGARNYQSFRHTVKRLEEVAITCRGSERVQLLRRWLVALKEIERLSSGSPDDKENVLDTASDETKESSKKPFLVLYFDSELGGEPMNFRDVFLYSQALEGLTVSMILEGPDDEEVALLLEIFGICLTGGKEVHHAIVSSIQDLAKVFSSYQDEVLVKRDELLQFAQGAIAGLKKSADIARIDAEVSTLQQKIDGVKASQVPSSEDQGETSEKTTISTLESLRGALAEVRLCSSVEKLLLKKTFIRSGDSPEVHSQKIDKLRILSDSLANSTSKAEKRISDHRHQKEEALKFRVTKSSEVSEIEKELSVEISALEKQRDELEAELKKVNASLTAALGRLHNTREEREQFDEASTKIVAHLTTKEDELSRSIASCRVESDVVKTWINFMEDTWVLQSSYMEQKDKQANEQLEKYRDYFLNLVINHLSSYKEELRPCISRIRQYVENLKKLSEGKSEMTGVGNDDPQGINPRKNLEEEYLDYEAKIITIFSVVDNMRDHFYALNGKVSGKDDPRVQELFDSLEKTREEFELIERPFLEMETPPPKAETQSNARLEKSPSQRQVQTIESLLAKKDETHEPSGAHLESLLAKKNEVPHPSGAQSPETVTSKKDEKVISTTAKTEQQLETEAELAKLESEFGQVSKDYSAEEIGGWEFDELEQELKSDESEVKK